jgi:hypothetical protein
MSKKPIVYAQGLYVNEKYVKNLKIVDLNIKADKFIEFIKENTDVKGYVKINLWPKTEPDKFGSHNAILNDWRPTGYGENNPSGGYQTPQSDDLPF